MSNFVKSPLNYVGGKYKLLPQIVPLFPKDVNVFIDVFSGGGNVGVNVNANKIICNDINKPVIDWCNECLNRDSEDFLEELDNVIKRYGLSKTNQEGFLSIREDYNNGHNSPVMFYAMLTHAFNYQIRFNSSGGYNMPFGKNRSSFNLSLRKKFTSFVDRLKEIDITFTNSDFRDINLDKLQKDDLVYCDPPYLITTASYNEQDGWNESREIELLEILDNVDKAGSRFALSNVLENKGKVNDILVEWTKKYNVHHLNYDYSNSSYQTKDRTKNSTKEVLITNY